MCRGGAIRVRGGRDDVHVQGSGVTFGIESTGAMYTKSYDHYQRSHRSLPSGRYAYAHARTITVNALPPQQTSFPTLTSEREGA